MKKTPGCVQSSEETKGVLSGEPNFYFSILMTWPVIVEHVKQRTLESLFCNIEAGEPVSMRLGGTAAGGFASPPSTGHGL